MARVTFTTDKQTVAVAVGEKLVDVCYRENLGIPFGCQNGICGTCLSLVKHGIDNLSPASEKERNTLALFTEEKHHRLVCQCALIKDDDVEIEN